MILYTSDKEPKRVYVNESKISLLEDVYASGRRGKNKIQLSYKKRLWKVPCQWSEWLWIS